MKFVSAVVLLSLMATFPVALCSAQTSSPNPDPNPNSATVDALRAEVTRLRQEMEEQRRLFEARLAQMEARLGSASPALVSAPATTGGVARATPERPAAAAPALASRLGQAAQSMNPDVSAIIDLNYHGDNSREGLAHVFEEMPGFGHAHPGGDHDHGHGPKEGFNMSHLELQFSAEIDPYFKGSAIAAISEDGAEMETAEMETTSLPGGLKLRGGKFFSDFGYINAQHSHAWDFVDRPLVYQLLLGAHGLNDKGLQLSWLAPTPFYLLAGVEAFQGDNEVAFAHHADDPLPSHAGPRLWVGWLKVGPNLPGNHGLQLGLFGAVGNHQEEHDGRTWDPAANGGAGAWVAGGDGNADHWLDGDTSFWGADLVYKYNSSKPYGQGDLTVQTEYFARRKDLEMVGNDFAPALIGNHRVDNQDGYYVQAVYGFLPRWRAGLRWEQVGLTNETELPDGSSESNGSSYRLGSMVDWSLSEFSRLRLQLNYGEYETADGRQDVTEVFLQWVISLGAHGAHKF